MKRRLFLSTIIIVSALATLQCEMFNQNNPLNPNINPVSENPAKLSNVLPAWRPCVGVQTPGTSGTPDIELQMDAVRRLHAAGRMDWIRLGRVSPEGAGKQYALRSKALGLKVFAIIDLADFNAGPTWESVFEKFYAAFPEVDIWEIAGEVSNGDPLVNPIPTTPEIYMEKLKKLVPYIKTKYPNVVLTSAPTLGAGGGPAELEKFIKLGLLDLDVIVTVNIYTPTALHGYAILFDRYAPQMRNKRIWVTETGQSVPELQIRWVEEFYPKIVNTLRPDMICWYILWDGDGPGTNTNGLLNGIWHPPLIEHDLFKKLVGGVR